MNNDVIRIKTRTGFECDIDQTRMNDMELLDNIVELENGNTLALSRVIGKLFPAVVKVALYDHVRTEDGRVPFDKLSEEIADVFNGLKDGKK